MASVFRKLICKELGASNYNKYFTCYQNMIENKTYNHNVLENDEIYEDIYDRLKDIDLPSLNKRIAHLSDAMFLVLRISKWYKTCVFVYLAGIIFLLFQGITFWIGVGSIILLSLAFLYKTYEFIVNKYCFIDAHIVIIYKTVLDRLLINYKLRAL